MKYFLVLFFVFVIRTKALKIDWRSYADNQLRGAEFEFARRLNKIGKPVEQTECLMTPPTVNPCNNVHMNEIVFPQESCNDHSTTPRLTPL